MKGWEKVAIKDLVDAINTWNPARAPPERTFHYIDLSAVDHTTKAITAPQTLSCAEAPSRARQVVHEGDVLVSTVRPNLNAVARVPKQLDGATASTGFCVLRPRPGVLDGQYLYHWVKTPTFINQMTRLATGANYPAVSDRIIGESEIPLPPLSEQRRIAAVLDRVEALRAKRREGMNILSTAASSLFVELFGHPTKSPKHERAVIRPFVEAGSGKSAHDVEVGAPTKIPIYGGNGVKGWASRPLFNEPVLVFGRVGQQCGITHLTRGPAWVTDNAIALRILDQNVLTLTYLSYAFALSGFSRRVKHLDLPFINQAMILDTEIPLPPIALQRQFGRGVVAIEATAEHCRAHLSRLSNFFDSLQHRAFRGEL